MLERPSTQFRIFRSLTVGDNQAGGIGSMTLPGTRIRGIKVDNPSGSWVMLDGIGMAYQPFIQPYTLAWADSPLPSLAELKATYVTGPTGQPVSIAGQPLVVYLFEEQVPSSGGSQFVTSTPEELSITVTITALSIAQVTPILGPPPAGQRYRLFGAKLNEAEAPSADANVFGLSGVHGLLQESITTADLGDLAIGPGQHADSDDYGTGLDVSVDNGVSINLLSVWGRHRVEVTLRYQVV